MSDSAFMAALGLMIITAAGVNLVARALRMPTIVAYLIAGLLIGPVFGWLETSERSGVLDTIGEMGIVLLMFLVGLELNLERLRQVGKVAVAAGLGQVVFTALGGFGIAWLLGFALMESLFIAVALTFSSTVVVVKLLDQKGDLGSLYGQIAVGIFLVQDLVVIVVLTFLAGLGSPEALAPLALAKNLLAAFLGMGLLLGFTLLAARYLLPRPLNWAAHAPRTLMVLSLCWCFVVVTLAHLMNLSAEVGAFLAGLSIAQLGCAHELRRRIQPLMSFFIVIFFVSLGAQMELGAALDYWLEAALLSLFVLIGNPFIFMWIIARYGYSERTCFETSVTVAQISEFSFIFAAAGVSSGLIGQSILAVIAVVGVVTFVLSAYLIIYNHRLYDWIEPSGMLRIFRAAREETGIASPLGPRDHIVIVGMNDLGRKLVTALHARGESVLAIDTDPRRLVDLPCSTMVGNVEYTQTLEEAHLASAKLAVSALRIASTNALFAVRCQSLGVPVSLHVFDQSVAESLAMLESCYLVQPKLEAGHRVLENLGALGLDSPPEPA